MKNKIKRFNGMLAAGLLAITIAPAMAGPAPSTNQGYLQVNLVSDLLGVATFKDPLLVNPWGIVAGTKSVWVNDNGSGVMTTYKSLGQSFNYAIHVPGPIVGDGTPTGLALNDCSQFVITNGSKHGSSSFLISTEDGTIAAWNSSVTGTNAIIVVNNSGSGAIYKGLAIAHNATNATLLYAANFHSGMVDMFDSHFNFVKSFTDTNLPPLFAPFNVRTLRGRIFVTFAKQTLPDMKDDDQGPGNGYVDIFDTDGTLLRSFAAEGVLNSPWGMTIAPNKFGKFSHALLVGNFGDGKINGFDLLTGKWLGNLADSNGNAIVIGGLWGLTFETEECYDSNTDTWNSTAKQLYFTAGSNGEEDGLFGIMRPLNPNIKPAQ